MKDVWLECPTILVIIICATLQVHTVTDRFIYLEGTKYYNRSM